MTKAQRAAMNRHLRRFANAVEDKAFQGTIPYAESEAAAKVYDAIDIELERARAGLVRFIERLAQ